MCILYASSDGCLRQNGNVLLGGGLELNVAEVPLHMDPVLTCVVLFL